MTHQGWRPSRAFLIPMTVRSVPRSLIRITAKYVKMKQVHLKQFPHFHTLLLGNSGMVVGAPGSQLARNNASDLHVTNSCREVLRFLICFYTLMMIDDIYIYKYICVYMYIYINVCMYVCMYVCMHACMYVCTYVRTYVRTYVCMHVCMYVRTYVRTYARMYVCMFPRICFPWNDLFRSPAPHSGLGQRRLRCPAAWRSCACARNVASAAWATSPRRRRRRHGDGMVGVHLVHHPQQWSIRIYQFSLVRRTISTGPKGFEYVFLGLCINFLVGKGWHQWAESHSTVRWVGSTGHSSSAWSRSERPAEHLEELEILLSVATCALPIDLNIFWKILKAGEKWSLLQEEDRKLARQERGHDQKMKACLNIVFSFKHFQNIQKGTFTGIRNCQEASIFWSKSWFTPCVLPGQEGREAVCRWDEGHPVIFWDRFLGFGGWTFWIHSLNISCILYTNSLPISISCFHVHQHTTFFLTPRPVLAGLGVCRIRLKLLKDMRIAGWIEPMNRKGCVMLRGPSVETSDVAREHVLAPRPFLVFRHFGLKVFLSLRDWWWVI